MNKFYVYQERTDTKDNLQLGDIISWSIDNKYSADYMIIQAANNKINLLNTKIYQASENEFNSLQELEKYLKNKAVDNNKINVLDATDWTIYVP